jgi:hypothetical protein
MPASNTVDSNLSGLSIAEETALKTLGGAPVWYTQEPNAISDFGGDRDYVAREPINASRTDQRGTITGVDPALGFTVDFTRRNVERFMQGFYWADAREAFSTKPLNAAQQPITSVASADNSYNAAAGLGGTAAGRLLLAEGFGVAGNNGLQKVVTVAAGKITVSGVLVNEAAPPAAAFLHEVGVEFAAADVAISVVSGIPTLTSAANALQTGTLANRLIPGAWVYLGGDLAANRFVNNRGYARIATVAAGAITFDETTWTPVTEAGTGLTIRMFYGTTIRNETNPSLIKRRSYHAERTLGTGNNGAQADYVEGAVPNDFTLTVPQKAKLTAELKFVGCDHTTRGENPGDVLKSTVGTIVAAPGEPAFNTSSHVVRQKLAVIDPTTSNPAALFAFVDEASFTIQNGVAGVGAVGNVGWVDTNNGNFKSSASITALFSTVDAVAAVRNNKDLSYNLIMAQRNSGFCFDVPMLGLGGGRPNIEKDQKIKLPLTINAAGSKYGLTSQYTLFLYLPTVAMP